mgnify:CR=1 FL=1
MTESALAVASGRYTIFHGGIECGEDRWRMDALPDDTVVLTGQHELARPHPFPNRQQYRVTLSNTFRLQSLEILWSVGDRVLRAFHAADGDQWRVRIDYQDHAREQQGDYPDICEVEYTTPLFATFMLSRRDFQLGGEHEFPVLRVGPPMMAVSPERMLMRCVERGEREAPWGKVAAKRYVVSLPPRGEDEGYSFWADEHDVLLESFEGAASGTTWMKLVEYQRGA